MKQIETTKKLGNEELETTEREKQEENAIQEQEAIKQKQHEEENILGTERIGKLVRKFSVPCIISLLVSALYNIVDQIFIGQGVGYLGNAATNVVFPITVIAMAFAFLLGDGGAAYLSLSLGRNDKKGASKGVVNSFMMAVILSIVFLVIGLVFKEPLLKIFGVTDAIHDYCNQYMTWIIIGLPFFIITSALNSIIRADGSPKYAMIAMLVGAIANIILDPIAIFVFHAGVKGAAIATVVGQILSAILSLIYLKKFKSIEVNKESFQFDCKVGLKVISLGISSFITQIAVTIVIIVMNNTLTKYGAQSVYGSEIPLSALGIVMKVNSILINISVGLAAGAQPIMGYNYGAKKYDRVKNALFFILKISLTVTTVFFFIFQFFPQIIINIFGQENGLYNEFAQKCFRIFLMFCMLNGIQVISGIFFQSIGKPIKSTIISLSRQIGFLVPSILILSYLWGVEGILYAGPVADGAAFILSIILLTLEIRKMKKVATESN